MTTQPIRVFFADDHPIVRQGLEVVINSQADMHLIGQAADGEEALAQILILQPDVCVLDLMMPRMNGLEVIKALRQAGLHTNILVLTSFPEDKMVIAAIEAGTQGVLLKDSPPAQLLEAIRAVSRGESVLHPAVTNTLIKLVQQSVAPTPTLDALTPREIDVLRCLALGASNHDIAVELSISTRTVTTHVRNILDKLGLANRTQAALYAVEHGISARPEV